MFNVAEFLFAFRLILRPTFCNHLTLRNSRIVKSHLNHSALFVIRSLRRPSQLVYSPTVQIAVISGVLLPRLNSDEISPSRLCNQLIGPTQSVSRPLTAI